MSRAKCDVGDEDVRLLLDFISGDQLEVLLESIVNDPTLWCAYIVGFEHGKWDEYNRLILQLLASSGLRLDGFAIADLKLCLWRCLQQEKRENICRFNRETLKRVYAPAPLDAVYTPLEAQKIRD